MIKTTLNFTIKALQKMREEKKTLDFEHVVQRGFVWSEMQQSLLIHSILASFPIPAIYCLKISSEKETVYSILDGKQRLLSTLDYVAGKYPLHSDTPPIVIDDEEYEIANKYFFDLDADVQQEILHFKFLMYGFEDVNDDEIGELFFRLNNGYLLNKVQQSISCTDFQTASFIKKLLSDKFFSQICKFTPLQKRKSDDMATLLQAMLLLDNKYNGYEYASLSADEVMQYATYIKNNYSEEQKERLFDIVDYLEKAFPTQEKMLKKINIPMIMLCADIAMGENYNNIKNIFRVGPMYFRQWFAYFFEECYEEYSQFCSSGSTKKEKTLKRIEIMENSLRNYFELNAIEDLIQDDADNLKEVILDEVIEVDSELEQEDDTTSVDEGVEQDKECENTLNVESLIADEELNYDFVKKPPDETTSMDSEEAE